MKKLKLYNLLISRGFFSSEDDAKRHIMAGKVLVDDRVIDQPGTLCLVSSPIRIKEKKSTFVSRGGDKLAGFLDAISLDIRNRCAVDVGISTGGFSDALLSRDAQHVLGIDVGYGILDYKLRNHPRLSLLERTNAREVTAAAINRALAPHQMHCNAVSLVVMDVSFISVFAIIPNLLSLFNATTDYIILIKPQFESKKHSIGAGGIIRDPDHLSETLRTVEASFASHGLAIVSTAPSLLRGTKGNQEYFYWVRLSED